LAERSAVIVDLRMCCSNLRKELATAQREVTSLMEKMQGLEQGLAWVSTE
jgi:hypothetical protein